MAREAARRGATWRMVYGGRTRTSMAFTEELAALEGDMTLVPQDEHGPIDLDTALSDLPDDTLVYCCGPEPLLTAVEERCPAGRLRLERFAAPSSSAPATRPPSKSSAAAPAAPSPSAPAPRFFRPPRTPA